MAVWGGETSTHKAGSQGISPKLLKAWPCLYAANPAVLVFLSACLYVPLQATSESEREQGVDPTELLENPRLGDPHLSGTRESQAAGGWAAPTAAQLPGAIAEVLQCDNPAGGCQGRSAWRAQTGRLTAANSSKHSNGDSLDRRMRID